MAAESKSAQHQRVAHDDHGNRDGDLSNERGGGEHYISGIDLALLGAAGIEVGRDVVHSAEAGDIALRSEAAQDFLKRSEAQAEAAYHEFANVTVKIIELSRQNTNIKSFELSLNRKRNITSQCEEILTSLQDAVQSRSFKATR